MVEVDGLARTISAKYRTGYLIQTEFVPVPVAGPSTRGTSQEAPSGACEDTCAINRETASTRNSSSTSPPYTAQETTQKESTLSKAEPAHQQFIPDQPAHETWLETNMAQEFLHEKATEVEHKNHASSAPCNVNKPRFFTPRECARLQGFPESFVIEQRNPHRWYHQCGNAVSPPVVAKIARQILVALMEADTSRAAEVDRRLTESQTQLAPWEHSVVRRTSWKLISHFYSVLQNFFCCKFSVILEPLLL